MGLRERKAARTRAQIIDVAIRLFTERGYEATTMEEIAEQAEVGSSTLYRYFPSKELLLLDPFARTGTLSQALRGRPAEEPIDLALGHAIHDGLTTISDSEPNLDVVRAIIDRSPGPRARLWDLIAQDRNLLEDAVAERLELDPSDLTVVLTTRIALLVIEVAADARRSSHHSITLSDTADQIIARLNQPGIISPRLPA
ncbi:TetR/AcrR family transcriptional regulator [Plantibacter sp. Mn2098]|uniref:TetR/AcrR family transcriptional regulator n=1 Tax=Plantibacter sp. Mn2098 TaxID=3395266 RepID=UPI003BC1F06E